MHKVRYRELFQARGGTRTDFEGPKENQWEECRNRKWHLGENKQRRKRILACANTTAQAEPSDTQTVINSIPLANDYQLVLISALCKTSDHHLSFRSDKKLIAGYKRSEGSEDGGSPS